MREKSLVILIVCLSLMGCSQYKEKSFYRDKLEDILGVKIPETFIVLFYRSDGAIGGDYTDEFEVQFKKQDFDLVMHRLDTSKFETVAGKDILYINRTTIDDERISIIITKKKYRIQYCIAKL